MIKYIRILFTACTLCLATYAFSASNAVSPVATHHIQAQRLFGGPVIHKEDVPGYLAIFNGDVWPLPDGRLVGLFRMAREGYQKISAHNERGYILKDYYSDIGLFLSHDFGRTWEFSHVFTASHHQLESHIQALTRVSHKSLKKTELIKKVLISLQTLVQQKQQYNILEDPRFMRVYDGSGKQRLFVFVTDVPSKLLSGSSFSDATYRMGAIEVAISADENLHILGYQRFGPRENKDNWILNIVPNDKQKAQMQTLKKRGVTISDTPYPIALSIRVNRKVQLIPFGALEDIFRVTDQQWEMILSQNDCLTTILEPDGTTYRSLGNNDQPKNITYDLLTKLIYNHPEYADWDWQSWRWYFYHQTKNSDKLEYETWVAVIDHSGFPIFRLPYSLQKPETADEIFGDIGYVVFNSGNLKGGDSIYHFNGVADTAVSVSKTNEQNLLHAIVKFPVWRDKLN